MADYSVTVNEKTQFSIAASDVQNLDVVAIDDHHFHLIQDGKTFTAEILHADHAAKTFTIRINGTKYSVQVADQYDQLVKKMGLTSMVIHKIKDVKAPMPGLVLDILVTPGQEIRHGDPLLILEAMKMENVIKSPGEGVVKTVKVAKGKAVDKGTVLMELE